LKRRPWVIGLLTVLLLLAALIYAAIRPPLLRAKARKAAVRLGATEYVTNTDFFSPTPAPSSKYWEMVDKVIPDDEFGDHPPPGGFYGGSRRDLYKEIHGFSLSESSVKVVDKDLSYLLSIPEISSIEVAFRNLSDDFLASLVRTRKEIHYLDLSGTFAGKKTAQALLEHPSIGGGSSTNELEIHLEFTNISREDAKHLSAFAREFSWTPAMPEEDLKRFHALQPAVRVAEKDEWNFAAFLEIDLSKLTTDHHTHLGAFSGNFFSIDFKNGSLDRALASTILQGKETEELAFEGVTLKDSTWMADLPKLSVRLENTQIELPEGDLGPFAPPEIGLLSVSDDCPLLGDGSLGRWLKGSEIDTLWMTPGHLELLNLEAPTNVDLTGTRDVKVRQFVFNMNVFATAADGPLAHLSGQTSVEALLLFGSSITSKGLQNLGRFDKLTRLTLQNGTEITDADLIHLLPVKKLEQLSLEMTEVTDACLPTLAKLPVLKVLDIRGTKISDIDRLLKLPALTHLICDGTFTEAERKKLQDARPSLSFERPESFGIQINY